MKDSKIEWTDHTCNLWWGCEKVHNHEGCVNCYAERFAHRYHSNDEGETTIWGANNPRKAVKSAFSNLLTWQAEASAEGVTRKVFVGSMMDIFEKPKPMVDWKGNGIETTTQDLRHRFFTEFVPACPNLIFLLLTKRPTNIPAYIPVEWKDNPPQNVWYGTSISTQKNFDQLVPALLKSAPANRFLSVEPQVEHIDVRRDTLNGIGWVIQGGESGNGRRPFDIGWTVPFVYETQRKQIKYFFKQIDKIAEVPQYLVKLRKTP